MKKLDRIVAIKFHQKARSHSLISFGGIGFVTVLHDQLDGPFNPAQVVPSWA